MHSMRKCLYVSFVLLFANLTLSRGFNVVVKPQPCRHHPASRRSALLLPRGLRPATQLNVLVDVPDGFFTFTFPVLGIMLSISRSFGRLRMEERAWEQRLEEAREKRLQQDPTVTEIELRRREAASEWSAYGNSGAVEADGGRSRVAVMESEENTSNSSRSSKTNSMTDEEIELFEAEYGIAYDPYYDEPYSEDELPSDISFQVDRQYGDRIYENGEIFYKDKSSGLFYRQGAKPRNLSFWK